MKNTQKTEPVVGGLIEFSERFADAVEKKGYPTAQRALGKKLGVSGTMIHYMFTGQRLPSFDLLTQIAARLGVSVNWLASGEGPRYPQMADLDEKSQYVAAAMSEMSSRKKEAVYRMVREMIQDPEDSE